MMMFTLATSLFTVNKAFFNDRKWTHYCLVFVTFAGFHDMPVVQNVDLRRSTPCSSLSYGRFYEGVLVEVEQVIGIVGSE